MRSALAAAAAALALLGAAGAAGAQAAGDDRARVVLAPLQALGVERRSRAVIDVERQLAAALASLDRVEVVAGKRLRTDVDRAGRPELRACDGEATCLTELARLFAARFTVYGEMGGFGSAQVVYLKLVDADSGREVRSTTLELGDQADPGAARAAAIRLLYPGRFTGRLKIEADVDGASIYVNGELAGRSPVRPIAVPVGTHALRVTHPEFRDFVRFVDVDFDQEIIVAARLQQFPVVASEIRRTGPLARPGPADPGPETTPWHRRWYTVAVAGVVLFVGSAIVAGMLTGGVDADREKQVR